MTTDPQENSPGDGGGETGPETVTRRPPTPDFSHLTTQEKQQIASVLLRLKHEEEADVERRR